MEIALRYHHFMHPDRPWTDVLPSLQWNINNAYVGSIQASAHEILFGFKLPGPLDVVTQTGSVH